MKMMECFSWFGREALPVDDQTLDEREALPVVQVSFAFLRWVILAAFVHHNRGVSVISCCNCDLELARFLFMTKPKQSKTSVRLENDHGASPSLIS